MLLLILKINGNQQSDCQQFQHAWQRAVEQAEQAERVFRVLLTSLKPA